MEKLAAGVPNYYMELLRDELGRRREKNSQYSLRAFAMALGIHASDLSRILSGHQVPSEKVALTIAKKLKLEETEVVQFFTSILHSKYQEQLNRLMTAVTLEDGLEKT